jgi:hypothetical protein
VTQGIEEQKAITILKKKDTHRDNPTTIKENAYKGADSCYYIEKERYL